MLVTIHEGVHREALSDIVSTVRQSGACLIHTPMPRSPSSNPLDPSSPGPFDGSDGAEYGLLGCAGVEPGVGTVGAGIVGTSQVE